MCLPINDRSMLSWLRTQIRVMEAWREEMVRRPEMDAAQAQKIDTHLAWLCAEYQRLEDVVSVAA
ncbi:MAG: hypothetical protein AAF216_03330 [Pseudomonadota bacterium]